MEKFWDSIKCSCINLLIAVVMHFPGEEKMLWVSTLIKEYIHLHLLDENEMGSLETFLNLISMV